MPGVTVKRIIYDCDERIVTSDHRPVYALFEVSMPPVPLHTRLHTPSVLRLLQLRLLPAASAPAMPRPTSEPDLAGDDRGGHNADAGAAGAADDPAEADDRVADTDMAILLRQHRLSLAVRSNLIEPYLITSANDLLSGGAAAADGAGPAQQQQQQLTAPPIRLWECDPTVLREESLMLIVYRSDAGPSSSSSPPPSPLLTAVQRSSATLSAGPAAPAAPQPHAEERERRRRRVGEGSVGLAAFLAGAPEPVSTTVQLFRHGRVVAVLSLQAQLSLSMAR